MYTVKIKFYSEFSDLEDKIETKFCFVPADSLKEVVEIMEQFYGREGIVEITIGEFSPDNFLEFDADLEDMFYDVKSTLGKRVIWSQISRANI